MSSRLGRRRGRPPKSQSQHESPRFLNARSSTAGNSGIEKPKWLLNRESDEPSRASSPNGSVGSQSQIYSARKHISVTPFRKRGRKTGTRGNRGGKAYVPRPSLVVTRGNDYHYGSDFDSGSDSEGRHSRLDEELDVMESDDPDLAPTDSEAELIEYAGDSDCESLSNLSNSVVRSGRWPSSAATTPQPFWLQPDREVPRLELPKSSEDLLLPNHEVLPACAIYEVLRKFSSEVRLSPFRLEDFMAALQSEELTHLLAEVHVQLLRSMLREEDAQQTWFGPLDQKDSINSMLHFSDSLTWPEVLRVYFQSDPIVFGPALSLIESCEYPFTSCAVRLKVLKFLTDHFLCNTSVRQEILSEGNIKYNDHCRVCQKVGDLLCCETCPAVYHLHCLDPPLDDVPNEDWQCPICTAQQCKGVTDCVSDVERSGFLCRQDCLGFDRHGRKYWFISRRIFVEEVDGLEEAVEEENQQRAAVDDLETKKPLRQTWYYSSVFQFEELLSRLDRIEYEKGLCQELYSLQSEILRQMAVTAALTKEFKGSNKSYLEIEEAEVVKVKAAKEAEEAAALKVKSEEEEEEHEVAEEDPSLLLEDATKTEIAEEEVVEECGVMDDDFMQQLQVESESKGAELVKPEPESSTSSDEALHVTRTKTGTIVPRTYNDPKRRPSVATNGPIKEETSSSTKSTKSPVPEVIFKLGMEGRQKSYVNHYSTNPLALNKNQSAEERDRKRYLSHKFSLTGQGEFKWIGPTYGLKTIVLQTVRTSLLQLHSQLPAILMHPNWATMRKSWISAVNSCVSPYDLGRVLTVLAACIRPVAFTSVWHESLGHIRLQRQTALDREEKKKLDKKEKKEKELEEEMHRLHTVHYTKGLKHQIWKHKGEEFRLHGQWGWRWLSSTRHVRRQDARQCGLRAGPWRVVVYDGIESRHVHKEPGVGITPYEIPSTDPAMELVDISASLLDPDRRVYSKTGKKAKLDSLLEWRVKLKTAEEKNLLKAVIATKVEPSEEVDVDVEGDNVEAQAARKPLSTEGAIALLENLRTQLRIHPCYSYKCAGDRCYSPSCRNIGLLVSRIAKDKEEEEKRKTRLEKRKMYSSDSTQGPVSLRRLLSDQDQTNTSGNKVKKKRKIPVQYPMMSTYTTKSKKQTIFVLPDHELRHLARRAAQGYVQGFHHGSKNNSTAWPYPSSRPVFKTCWFYRTNGLQSLGAAALQLRILWACLRWDDMAIRSGAAGSSADGKNQLTTETEIITTDILKHRHVGRFLERTQYFQRRVIIPLDVPKTVREITPSRSGLRKRKMVETPRLSQPIVTEDWVDEDRLDLWVIKHYHERVERAAANAAAAAAAAASSASTPTSNMTRIKAGTPQSTGANKLTMEELKEKAEQQLRAQRAAHQMKNATSTPTGTSGVVRSAVSGGKTTLPGTKTTASLVTTSATTGTPTYTRRIVIGADGKKTIQLLKTTAGAAAAATSSGGTLQLIAPSPSTTTAGNPLTATPITAQTVGKSLQIIKGADGKIQIRGLMPGQQLLRLPDGRLSIVNPSQSNVSGKIGVSVNASAAVGTTTDASGTAVNKTILVKSIPAGQKIAVGQQHFMLSGNNSLAQQLASGKLQLGVVNGQKVLVQSGSVPNVALQPMLAVASAASKPGETTSTAQTTNPVTTTTTATAIVPSSTPTAPNKQQTIILHTPQGQKIVVQNLHGGTLTPQQLAAIQEQVGKSQIAISGQTGTKQLIVRATPSTVAVTPTITVKSTPTSSAVTSIASTAVASTVTTTATTTTAISTVTTPVTKPVPIVATTPKSPEKEFVVTPDFIQQAIRKALKHENLHPDVEQKLLQYQRFQEKQKKDDGDFESPALAPVISTAARKRTASSSWNEEFDGIQTSLSFDAKRTPARKAVRALETPTTPTSRPVASRPSISNMSAAGEDLRDQKSRERSIKAAQRAKEKRHQNAQAKLQGILNKHSELLKKEILRKRTLLERELRVSIQKELAALKPPSSPVRSPPRSQAQSGSLATTNSHSPDQLVPIKKEKQSPESPKVKTPPRSQKKRKPSTKDQKSPALESPVIRGDSPEKSVMKKRKRTSSEGTGGSAATKKKLYCSCRKPYDNTKFYVGCDVCSNWFHGDCVGITEAMSQTMSEFVCEGCRQVQNQNQEGVQNQELYCLCRLPYDESQFYICCDQCQDWFHGRCVGVLQSESEAIDEYTCPNCNPDSPFNYANTRTLCASDYEELRSLLRNLQTHKSSWPFRLPVNQKDVPDYYQVIKQPMDLRMIESKIQERRYQRLVDFISDVTLIFANCFVYNEKNSSIARCATTLESFFVPRLKALRAAMSGTAI